MKEKETVMDLVMEVNMMDTEDVREILCVEAITVNNLVLTIMRKMIVVKNQNQKKIKKQQQIHSKTQIIQHILDP